MVVNRLLYRKANLFGYAKLYYMFILKSLVLDSGPDLGSYHPLVRARLEGSTEKQFEVELPKLFPSNK